MNCQIDETTVQLLRCYANRYETADFIIGDPSYWMHQVHGEENQETTAFLASCISYGSRKQFMPKIQQFLDWADGDVYLWVKEGCFNEHFKAGDTKCFYRLYNNNCMNIFLTACQYLIVKYGSIGRYVRSCAHNGFEAVEALCTFFASKGVSVVVPKDTQSACKRVCMFLRWMVRDGSPVDLGLWADCIDRRTLIMPLDTHVVSQSVRLGLLNSSCASMSAARRLTATLATIFPDDPLRGDFALFGYGVNNTNNQDL